MGSFTISVSEKRFISEGCRQNYREDGRTCTQVRPYLHKSPDVAEGHPLALSHGSSHVFLETGETDLLVSVKADLVSPSTMHPLDGVVSVSVEHLGGRNEELETTLADLYIPHVVNTKRLCVTPHQCVWRLMIDVFIQSNTGGSLLDACGRGILAALQATKLPHVRHIPTKEEGKPAFDVTSSMSAAVDIPGLDLAPSIWTISVLATNDTTPVFLVDANQAEEACALAQAHIVVGRSSKGSPKIFSLQKAGGGSLPFATLQSLTNLATELVATKKG
eukprot:Nitzschia sp. Nitz4//scaffold38_size140716//108925//109752//NITZ4_003161-RA/size140716-processed-gene-0.41-mRNA-1//1//CDS//3329550120//7380//frame0